MLKYHETEWQTVAALVVQIDGRHEVAIFTRVPVDQCGTVLDEQVAKVEEGLAGKVERALAGTDIEAVAALQRVQVRVIQAPDAFFLRIVLVENFVQCT